MSPSLITITLTETTLCFTSGLNAYCFSFPSSVLVAAFLLPAFSSSGLAAGLRAAALAVGFLSSSVSFMCWFGERRILSCSVCSNFFSLSSGYSRQRPSYWLVSCNFFREVSSLRLLSILAGHHCFSVTVVTPLNRERARCAGLAAAMSLPY